MKGAHMRELLKPDYIFVNQRPKSASLDAALELISEKCSEYAGVRASELKKMFLKREKMDSTGFGEQLAIPHAKVKRLDVYKRQIQFKGGQIIWNIQLESKWRRSIYLMRLVKRLIN